jgi:hypothetical protein
VFPPKRLRAVSADFDPSRTQHAIGGAIGAAPCLALRRSPYLIGRCREQAPSTPSFMEPINAQFEANHRLSKAVGTILSKLQGCRTYVP